MEPEQAAGGEVLSLARPRRGVALPSGDVTFVFTDIEGSTRLLTALGGEEFAPLLAVHQSIVAKAMADVGAVLINAEGDEMFFACGEATTAVSGVLAAQAAMAAYPWPTEHPLRIRAGMHTGPARPIGHSYIALAVHQAARISAAGHGGQGLASAMTAGLVERPGRELGRFRLKDFDEPVALVQYDDGDHPPLKVLPEAVRRLVLPDTSFVGREGELAELAHLLETHRLVTICGPGGAGKTRLAVELASRAPADLQVAVAELAGARNEAEVVSAVAAAFDLAQSTEVAVIDLLTRYVAERPGVILVLDNCEQVLDPVAGLVTELLRSAPSARLLLTSREPLGTVEERLVRLAPLDSPVSGATLESLLVSAGARLLVDRVMARDATFRLEPDDVEHVVAICQRLEGSPLALELVAAEIAAAGLSAARTSVETGAGLDGGRGRPARHRSIEAALDWSYQLLEPSERLVWARLAVFVAPFRNDDAVAIASSDDIPDQAVRSAVTALINKSVVTRVSAPDGDRYRMHQTVREFGTAKLRAAGELDPMRDRHADWSRDFLDQNHYRVTPQNWFAAFQVCRDDLVAAWHHLRGTGQAELAATVGGNTAYWDYFTGRSAEGAALLADLASWPDGPYLAGARVSPPGAPAPDRAEGGASSQGHPDRDLPRGGRFRGRRSARQDAVVAADPSRGADRACLGAQHAQHLRAGSRRPARRAWLQPSGAGAVRRDRPGRQRLHHVGEPGDHCVVARRPGVGPPPRRGCASARRVSQHHRPGLRRAHAACGNPQPDQPESRASRSSRWVGALRAAARAR